MNRISYIYILGDRTGIRYVGQSVEPKIRLGRHVCDARAGRDKTRRGNWLRNLDELNDKPAMILIDTCFEGNESNERERYWFNFFLQKGCNLLNASYKNSL